MRHQQRGRRCGALIVSPCLSPLFNAYEPTYSGFCYEFKTGFLRSAGIANIADGAVAARIGQPRCHGRAARAGHAQMKPDTVPAGDFEFRATVQPLSSRSQRLDAAVAHEQGSRSSIWSRQNPWFGNVPKASRRICGATTGQKPGPTIEVVGEIAYAFCHQQTGRANQRPLAWAAPAEWLDGVAGINQPGIAPGKPLSTYEFVARRPGYLHVSPACRRNGADGDGHDGLWITIRRTSIR